MCLFDCILSEVFLSESFSEKKDIRFSVNFTGMKMTCFFYGKILFTGIVFSVVKICYFRKQKLFL